MDQLKLLTKNICDCCVELGDRHCYLVPISKRATFSNETEVISVGRMAAKIQEIIIALNFIIEKINNLESKNE